MEFVATADIHAHTYYNMGGFDKEFGSVRLRHTVEVLNQILRYCNEHKIKTFLILGDIFHTRGFISTFVVKSLHDVLEHFNKSNIEVVLLAGNHDQATKDYTPTALSVFRGVAKIVEKPEVYMDCLFLPYTSSSEQIEELLSKHYTDVVFGHLGVSGGTVGEEDYELTSELKPEVFRDCKLVLLGHYHKPQTLENIVYVGSPLHINFSDAGQTKGFVHFEHGKLHFVRTEYPEFIVFEVKEQKDLKVFQSMYSENNFYWIKNFLGKDLKIDKKNVRITDEKADIQKFTPRIADIHTMSDAELVRAFVKQFKLQNPELFVKYGLKILEKVRTEVV